MDDRHGMQQHERAHEYQNKEKRKPLTVVQVVPQERLEASLIHGIREAYINIEFGRQRRAVSEEQRYEADGIEKRGGEGHDAHPQDDSCHPGVKVKRHAWRILHVGHGIHERHDESCHNGKRKAIVQEEQEGKVDDAQKQANLNEHGGNDIQRRESHVRPPY